MDKGELRYDRMVQDALRGVVGRALSYVAEHGLPGEHHLYITFRTDHPGALVPARLRESYPSEMTIVLQYQFWDLEVAADKFAVTLTFGKAPERLSVPYDAVVAFADPSVRFGLQFDVGAEAGRAAAVAAPAPAEPAAASEKVVPLDTFRKKST